MKILQIHNSYIFKGGKFVTRNPRKYAEVHDFEIGFYGGKKVFVGKKGFNNL